MTGAEQVHQISVQVGEQTYWPGAIIGSPDTAEARELIARMVIEWARGFAPEGADLDD